MESKGANGDEISKHCILYRKGTKASRPESDHCDLNVSKVSETEATVEPSKLLIELAVQVVSEAYLPGAVEAGESDGKLPLFPTRESRASMTVDFKVLREYSTASSLFCLNVFVGKIRSFILVRIYNYNVPGFQVA